MQPCASHPLQGSCDNSSSSSDEPPPDEHDSADDAATADREDSQLLLSLLHRPTSAHPHPAENPPSLSIAGPAADEIAVQIEQQQQQQHPPLCWRLRLRLSLLWAFELIHRDLDVYFTYVVYLRHFGCDYYLQYSEALLLGTFLSCGWSACASSVLDRVRASSMLLWLPALLVLTDALYLRYPVEAYLCHSLLTSVVDVLVWKTIKLNLPTGPSSDEENSHLSSVGNLSDIVADIVEAIALLGGVCMLSSQSENDDSQSASSLSTTADPTIVYFLALQAATAVAVSVLAFCLRKVSSRAEEKSLVQMSLAASDDPRTAASSVAGLSRVGILSSFVLARIAFARAAFVYLWRSPVVLHGSLHALLVLCLYNFVAYPLAYLTVAEQSSADSSSSCSVQVVLLLRMGSILCFLFLCASVGYNRFLVKMAPRKYFGRVLPVLGLVEIACLVMASVLLLMVLPPASASTTDGEAAGGFSLSSSPLSSAVSALAISVFVAVAQILPYVMNGYSWYLFTNAIDAKYYGFLSSLYTLSGNLLYLASYFLIAGDTPLAVLVVMCICMAIGAIVYGLYLCKHVAATDWKALPVLRASSG